MKKDDLRTLITFFFENNFSKEIILKFQLWFIRTEDKRVNDEILNELWENETAKVSQLTFSGLEEMNRRIGKEMRPVRKLSIPRLLLRVAAVLLLPAAGALLTYLFMNEDNIPAVAVAEIVEHIIPDGDMKQIILPDSSEVWLNAGSMLLYSSDFSGSTRTLFLNGEAMFKVVKDAERPFIVNTQYMKVQALGTTFNVKAYGDSGETEVTLEEGLVKVDLDGKVKTSELVHPNEQLIYNHKYGKISKQQVDAELVSRWKDGYLVFHNASFEEIIRTIERRFKVTVNYDIRKYGGGSFAVKYTPFEDVNQVLLILETLNPGLTWTMEDDRITIK